METCLFCKIAKGEIPSKKVYEDEWVFAFHDINPVAPVHVLVIPKEHIKSASEINNENSSLIANIFNAVTKVTKELGIADEGYRVITNCGEAAGQTVGHLHFHVIGGKKLDWPQ